jgi:hypothetical protein
LKSAYINITGTPIIPSLCNNACPSGSTDAHSSEKRKRNYKKEKSRYRELILKETQKKEREITKKKSPATEN